MYYRISNDKNDQDKLIIEDILVPSERLLKGYNEKCGSIAHLEMNRNKFLRKLASGIYRCNSIVRFELDGYSYKLDWVEWTKNGAIFHEDVIELVNDDTLKASIEHLRAYYIPAEEETRKNVLRKYIRRASDNSILKKCWHHLMSFSMNRATSDIDDKKTIAQMYRYISEHKSYFECCPVDFKEKKSLRQLKLFDKILFAEGIFLALLNIIFGKWLFLIPIIMAEKTLIKTIKGCNSTEKEKVLEVISSFQSELRPNADPAYLKALETKDLHSTSQFIGFIERDLAFLHDHPEYNFDEDVIRSLGEDYSKESYELLGTSEEIDKIAYINMLLAAESLMFSKNTKVGAMGKSPLRGFEYLYEVFEYLGYSKDAVRSDPFVYKVRSSMRTIIENPYYGCESEIIYMINLAVNYAVINGLNQEVQSDSEMFFDDAIEMLEKVFDQASRKIIEAQVLSGTQQPEEGSVQPQGMTNEGAKIMTFDIKREL